jgi:hypothetical protein
MVLVSLVSRESRVVVLEDTISICSLSFIPIGSTLLRDKVDKCLHGLRVLLLLKNLKISLGSAGEANVADLVGDEDQGGNDCEGNITNYLES